MEGEDGRLFLFLPDLALAVIIIIHCDLSDDESLGDESASPRRVLVVGKCVVVVVVVVLRRFGSASSLNGGGEAASRLVVELGR